MNKNNLLVFLPQIDKKPFLVKAFILGFLMLFFMMLTMVIGLVVAIPFFGFEVFLNFGNLSDLSDSTSISFLKYMQALNQLGLFILPALFFAYLYRYNALEYLKLSTRINLKYLSVSIVLILVSIPAINYIVLINEQMKLPEFLFPIEQWMRSTEDATKQLTDAFLSTDSLGGFFVNMLIIALLAAVGEELLFRGVVLRLLLEGVKNIHLAIFISAFLFSAMHLQFYGFLPRLLIGIIFGYIFVWSANLWIPIILHFIFNGISVVAAYLFKLGKISTDVETFGNSENAAILISSLVISLGLLYLLYTQRQTISIHESNA